MNLTRYVDLQLKIRWIVCGESVRLVLYLILVSLITHSDECGSYPTFPNEAVVKIHG